MKVKIENLRLHREASYISAGTLIMWTLPTRVDLVSVEASYVLLELHYASGAVIKECVSNADLYSGQVKLTDENGRPIDPWLSDLNKSLGRKRDDDTIKVGCHRSDEEFEAFEKLHDKTRKAHEGNWI